MALAIWVCSLTLTGIVLYSKERLLPGFQLLAIGWLSPLVFNFAWFANIFLLKGCFRLLSGKTATKASVFAVLFSLDTFRFTEFVLNEGGATAPVYGYGWGAILWFLSIFILMAAAGLRNQEEGCKHLWMLPISFTFFVGFLGGAAYFFAHDRMAANSTEARRLAGIAFKRGGVCSAPEPLPLAPLHDFFGPLEVLVSHPQRADAQFPFGQIKYLLEWGVPIVRVNNRDYSINPTSHGPELVSVPAHGTPSAVLEVTENKSFDGATYNRSIRAKLVNASNQTIFDQTWKREPLPKKEHDYFCPDYKSFPAANEQPRRLLIEALNLREANQTGQAGQYPQEVFESVEGSIVGRADGGVTREMKIARWKEAHPKTEIPVHESYNEVG